MNLPEGSPIQGHLDRIEQASLRAADLTRQMLAYAGHGRAAMVPLNLDWLLLELKPQLAASGFEGAELRFELAPELPELVGDASQLQQMVMNLVTNAREAIGEHGHGTVTVRTGEQVLDQLVLNSAAPGIPIPPGHYVTLEVADTGCGIPAEIRDRIFDPFFSTRFMGRGLGLPALLGMLRRHGGSIQIHSEPARGSLFRLFLPVPERES
jgi:signal transduction histidine kinase